MKRLSKKLQKERQETLADWKNPPGAQYVVTCSGTLVLMPSTQSEWDTFRSQGVQLVDGFEDNVKGY